MSPNLQETVDVVTVTEETLNPLMPSGNICYHFLFQYCLFSTGYQTKSSCDEHSRMMQDSDKTHIGSRNFIQILFKDGYIIRN